MDKHYEYLTELYDRSNGNPHFLMGFLDVAKNIGMPTEGYENHTHVVELVNDLVEQSWVTYSALGCISITDDGKDEIEGWL